MDLLEKLRAAGPAIFDDQPVLFAYLFGSRAPGRPRPDSDIDIAVYAAADAPEGASFEMRTRLPFTIEKAAAVRDVEVVVLNELPLRFVGRVLRDRRVIYSRVDAARCEYERAMLKRYLDFEPRALELDRLAIKATAEGRR